jgi:hypothetical protein
MAAACESEAVDGTGVVSLVISDSGGASVTEGVPVDTDGGPVPVKTSAKGLLRGGGLMGALLGPGCPMPMKCRGKDGSKLDRMRMKKSDPVSSSVAGARSRERELILADEIWGASAFHPPCVTTMPGLTLLGGHLKVSVHAFGRRTDDGAQDGFLAGGAASKHQMPSGEFNCRKDGRRIDRLQCMRVCYIH